jgi:hypothetical protein
MKSIRALLGVATLSLVLLGAGPCTGPDCDDRNPTYKVKYFSRTTGDVRLGPGEFKSLPEAVEAAEAGDFCKVRIDLEAGDFYLTQLLEPRVDVSIRGASRDSTRIHGAIASHGFDLELMTLTVQDATGTAVTSSHGHFAADQIRITGTRTVPGQLASGLGLLIVNATATLTNATFDSNEGRAIHVKGPLASLKAYDLAVSDNDVNAEAVALDRWNGGAVAVTDKAIIDLTRADFFRNRHANLLASTGGRIYAEYLDIGPTYDLVDATASTPGAGLWLGAGTKSELHHFVIENGGIGVILWEAYLTGFNGLIRNNRYPYVVSDDVEDPYYDERRCLAYSSVYFLNNEQKGIDDGLPVPNAPPCTIDPVTGESQCPPPPQLAPCVSVARVQ